MKKLNQNGSHILAVAVIIVVVIIIGLIGIRVFSKVKDSRKEKAGGDGAGYAAHMLDGCSGKGPVKLTHVPIDMKDVSTIVPLGALAGAHVTPIDHLYFYPTDMQNRDAAPVYAMADGFIKSVQRRSVRVDTGNAQKPEYQVIFQHNCSTITYFDLLTSLDPAIASKVDFKDGDVNGDLNIPVKAGQVVGRVGAQSLDTAVYNMDMTLKGFANPASYKSESFKLHTDDFFKYFSQADQSSMQAKNMRKFQPYSGKIDYDAPGKLIGNWFVEGTNGYLGGGQNYADSNGQGYWSTHLAIVPDATVENQTDLSFGDYQGKAMQFVAAKGSPDPANVDTKAGLVKYEYVKFNIPGPSLTGSVPVQETTVLGTALFQISADGKLRAEAFPGKTADQVSAFTSAAKTYVR